MAFLEAPIQPLDHSYKGWTTERGPLTIPCRIRCAQLGLYRHKGMALHSAVHGLLYTAELRERAAAAGCPQTNVFG